MVTKLVMVMLMFQVRLILAKNHMVTKHYVTSDSIVKSLILAKNHMVTKPQIHVTIYLKIIKY